MGQVSEVRIKHQMEAGDGQEQQAPPEVLSRLREEARNNPIRQRYEIAVKLHDGSWVGNWSMDWRLECEAKRLLAMPLDRRRRELAIREDKRGKAAVDALKARMTSIHRGVAKASIAQ